MTVGFVPQSAGELNTNGGLLMQQFINIKEGITHWHEWLAGIDLKAEPYLMSAQEETIFKSAFADLDTALDAINMTFVNQIAGPFS